MIDRRTVTILGATGSVGGSTLDLIERNRERYDVVALTARQDVDGLADAGVVEAAPPTQPLTGGLGIRA